MLNLTKPEIVKLINKQFPKKSVKIENEDGHSKALRDNDDKIVKLVHTGVKHSPMDVTNIKNHKVQTQLNEVHNFLKSLGSINQENKHTFTTKNGKTFDVIVNEERIVTDLYYRDYKTSFINIEIL